MKAAIAIDPWKLNIFTRHLKDAGFDYEVATDPDVITLGVVTETPEELRPAIEAAMKEAQVIMAAARKTVHSGGNTEVINPQSAMIQQSEGMWQKYLALVIFKLTVITKINPMKSVVVSAKEMERFDKYHAQCLLTHGHHDSIEFKLVDEVTAKRLAEYDATRAGKA